MKVRCINNKGDFLRRFEYGSLEKNVQGRFGATDHTEYNEIDIGTEYLVMGIIIFKTYQAYLIDDFRLIDGSEIIDKSRLINGGGFIYACPCQLFEVVDNKVSPNWHFRLIEKDEDIYPFVQAIFGYPELCSDKKAYENLIVEMEEETQSIYFRRKIELEKELA